MTDPVGTLEKALERNLFHPEHVHPLPFLDLTLGVALVTHSFPIKPAFQGVGSVLIGSAQCNHEVKTSLLVRPTVVPKRSKDPALKALKAHLVARGMRLAG